MGNINKIIYYSYNPLTTKYFEDCHIDYFQSEGFEVEYWCVEFILKTPSGVIGNYNYPGYIEINSYKQFIHEVKKQDNNHALYICLDTLNCLHLRTGIILSCNNCKTAALGINTVPCPIFSYSNIWDQTNDYFFWVKRGLMNKLYVLLKKIGVIHGLDVAFVAGSNGRTGMGRVLPNEYEKAHKVNINSDDYDKTLSMAKVEVPKEKFILFIDEYIPFHPDFNVVNQKNISEDKYFSTLNSFFYTIEEKYGMPVIISAHPKAEKYKTKNYFNGRKIVYGQSCALSKYAECVMTHFSTAIAFPVIFGRPILLLSAQFYKDDCPLLYYGIQPFCDELNIRPVYIDNIEESMLDYTINKNDNNKYLYKYLTSKKSENLESKVIINNFLKNTKL